MRNWILILLTVLLTSCVNVVKNETTHHKFTSVEIDPVYADTISIRALQVNEDRIFFAGREGQFGYLNTADNSIAYLGKIENDSITPEFRALATTKDSNFMMSAGNPALIYRVNYFGKRELAYQESGTGVFYDALAFWNDNEGIAMGDPTGDCISILITRNAGETWKKVACKELPKIIEGEAAFAASNSNIAIVGDKTWLLSGGKKSRVYYSPDKGKTWEVFDTPLLDGKKTTGGYSIDFYDEKTGFIMGGDYTQPKVNNANKAITRDGGKTWKLVADGEAPGYKSCVKYVPDGKGKELVAVGITGISYSNDYGGTWRKLSNQPFYTLSFLNEYTAFAAGENKIVKITFMENDFEK